MNWFMNKQQEIEMKARKKCNICHVYMKDSSENDQCDYCLGLKTRKPRKEESK